MPYKHDINYDFLGPDFSTELPELLHAPPGLEAAAPQVYRGPGGQEGPGAPCGEKVPHTQTGPGTVDRSSPARVRSLARPSQDGPLIPAHKVLLSSVSCLPPSRSYLPTSSTSSLSSSSSSSTHNHP